LRIQPTTLGNFKIAPPTCSTPPMNSPARSKAFFVRVPFPLALINRQPNSLHLASWGAPAPRPRPPPTQRAHEIPPPNTGLHFEFHSGPAGGSTRTFILGGPNTLGRSPPQPDRPVPTMSEFLRRDPDNTNNMHPPGEIAAPLMAQYLLTLFGREPHDRGDPFTEFLGMPPSSRWGDYVFNQEALDQILTQLADGSTGGRPVPATEDIISDLPREVLTEGSPLLERDCAVCKESFKLDPEDPDELVVVTLPCKHPFHEGCIIPWVKSSGTCPVCRYALIAQPQQQSPGGPSGGSSSSNRANPSSGSRPRSPGNSNRGRGGGLFHALFGGGAGASGGSSDTHSTRSQRNPGRGNRNVHPEVVSHSTPRFPGQWIEDID
jgi:E3 ubiquitin-protein ligase RNF115/126